MANASKGPAHTPGHKNCPTCESIKKEVMSSGRTGERTFSETAWQWIEQRRAHLAPKTARDYEDYIRTLEGWFGPMALREIDIGHVVAYQRSRQAAIRKTVQHKTARSKRGIRKSLPTDGASRVNHEVFVLRQVLKRAGLWTDVAKFYESIPVPKDGPGIALTPEEERHLFRVASSRPRWLVAYHCSVLSRNTTAGPSEILGLRIRNVDVGAAVVHIEEGVKNVFRVRSIPLNGDALASAEWLLGNAARHGALMPDHYLFPHRADTRGMPPDPTRPMGSYKKAWEAVRKEAGKKFPRLLTVRRYDLRHTACTAMLENPAIPEATIEAIMGHRLGSRTKMRYRHLRDQTLRAATDAIASSRRPDPPPPRPGPQREVIVSDPRGAARVAGRGRLVSFPGHGNGPEPA